MFSIKRLAGTATLIVAFLVVVIFFATAVTYIKPGFAGVIQNKVGGKLEVKATPGWTWVNPFTQRIVEYPISTQILQLTKSASDGSSKQDDSVWLPTLEGQNVNADLSISYHVDDVKKLYTKYAGADIDYITHTIIRGELNNQIMAVTGKMHILELNDNRDVIAAETLKRLQQALAESGIVVETTALRRLDPPESVAKSFAQKIEAENAVKQAESKLAQAKIEAETRITQATAEAKANEIINASLTPQLIQLRQIEKLSDKVQVIYVPTNTSLFLNPQK